MRYAEGVIDRPRAPKLVAIAGVLVAVTTLGAVFSPWLLAHEPLWLVGISPVGRHMVAVAALSAMVPFVAVVFGRRFLDGLISFSIGRAYGEDAVAWFVVRAPKLERSLRAMERAVKKLGPFALLIVPGVISSLLVGSVGVSRRTYLAFATVGYLASTYLIYRVGAAIASVVTPLVDAVRGYAIELTLGCVLLYALSVVWRRARAEAKPAAPEPVDP